MAAKPGERKLQILQTLAEMLQQPRGEKITTAALAARLGVSEAALYRHFASKEQMFEGLIEFIEQTLFGLINRITSDEQSGLRQLESILGVMLGFERIPAKFKADLPKLENTKFDYTDYSFNDIVKSTEARALKVIRAAGGEVTDSQVVIKMQKPKAPKLEQWSPGIPDRRIAAGDAAWTWTGSWKDDRNAKRSEAAGNEAVLKFDGVAVAVLGNLDQLGGRADVYLDGQKHSVPLDAYIVPNTHDNVLWQAYGLKSGPHTLRIVTTDAADARSKGRQIAISEAVVYWASR